MNPSNSFSSYWERQFLGIYPIDFNLKNSLHKYWFRIHSLPNSKRYPETTEEYDLILSRQRNLVNDVIGEDNEIFCVIGCFSENSDTASKMESNLGEFKEEYSFKVSEILGGNHYSENDLYKIYSTKIHWKFNFFKDVLMKIIDGEYDYRLMIVSPEKNRIVIPYDGGIDIIMESKGKKDIFKEKYQSWLSRREDGL